MGELLDKQYQYYTRNKDAIRKKYGGQWVVIHGEKVVESFGSEKDAYIFSIQQFKIGTFFIQQVEPE